MRIAIDGRVLDRGMTGIGRYLMNFLDELPKLDRENEYFIFLNDSSLVDSQFFKVIPVKKSFLPSKVFSFFWLNFVFPREAQQYKFDLFFTCNVLLPFVNIGSTRKVTVVHDVIYKVCKMYYPFFYRAYLNFLLPLTFKSADKVITASLHSKEDIVKSFNISGNKVDVLYTSASKLFYKRDIESEVRAKLLIKYRLPEKFILYVGVIEKRKNIEGLFRISDKLAEKNFTIPIVLVGRPGFKFENIKELVGGKESRIRYLNFVDDEDLPLLYNIAELFIFPSFYEGFGIPPIEAMQSGTAVISSNGGALSEVVEGGAVVLSPHDIDGFVNEIIKLSVDQKYREMWENNGLQRSKYFDISKSAQNLVKIFNSL